MEIHKHPMHIMPAMKLVKSFVATGSFGADAVTLGAREMDTEAIIKGARLHREAIALSKMDGGPKDLEPAENKVYTSDGRQVESGNNGLIMCTSNGDSTTYFVVQNFENPATQRVAYAVQSNLEMGGPPTEYFGVTLNLETKQYSGQKMTEKNFF